MNPAISRLFLPCATIVAVLILAWIVFRLGKVRRTMAGTRDEGSAEAALRAQAQALLAARLARGEIDEATHRQLVQRLWGVDAPVAPPETHPVGH